MKEPLPVNIGGTGLEKSMLVSSVLDSLQYILDRLEV